MEEVHEGGGARGGRISAKSAPELEKKEEEDEWRQHDVMNPVH